MNKIIVLISLLILNACIKSQNNIVGCWRKNENVDMIFGENGKLEYFGNEYLYNYKVNNNKLSILDSNNVVLEFTIISLTKDSLILKKDSNEIYKYVKLKGCKGNIVEIE